MSAYSRGPGHLKPTGFPLGTYFCAILISNALLSYFPLSTQTRLWIGLFGLLLPLFMIWRIPAAGRSGEKPFPQGEFLPALPLWGWCALGLLVVFTRFYHLTTFSVWPLYDEGMYGHYAIGLFREWKGTFFFGPSQAPPLYLWMLAGLFKCFGVSLTSLWLLPALISALLFPLSYWAARGMFNRSFSFLFSLLFGLSFWPLFVGRLSLMTGLVLLWECLALGLLARLLVETHMKKLPLKAAALGAVTGGGFYTYLHWPALALMVGLTLLFFIASRWKSVDFPKWKVALLFFSSIAVVLCPLAWGFLREGWGQILSYLQHLSAMNQPLPWKEQFGISFSYLASLFWGMDLKFHTYQPVWGGYLNPVLGGLFFLGLVEALRRWKQGLALWVLSGLVLFILPGALTSERATSRMILVFPILCVLVVWGFYRLWREKKFRFPFFLGLALLSLGLDGRHLASAYPSLWGSLEHWKGYGKSYARYQAFLELERIARERGPGYCLVDFVPGLSDKTMEIACFRFHLGGNPRLKPGLSPWVAVLVNAHYQPFLKKEFPDGKAWWVSRDLGVPDGGWMLWVMSMDPSRVKRIQGWRKAEAALEPFIEKNLLYVPGKPFGEIVGALEKAYPSFRNDPFLESCFWEKMADTRLRAAFLSNGASGPGALAEAGACIRQALQKGYPASHFHYHLGILALMGQNIPEAQKAFQRATRSPLDLTDSAQHLQALRSVPKGR